MELYEIIKITRTLYRDRIYKETSTVITASTDKEMIYNMLDIYKSNQSMDESYVVRTVRMPKRMEW